MIYIRTKKKEKEKRRKCRKNKSIIYQL